MFRTLSFALAALAALGLAGASAPSRAGGMSSGGHGSFCPPPHGSTININKPVNIYKPININNSVHINKQIWINKPVTIQHNVNIHKNIVINKPVIINKGNASAEAIAVAAAAASAQSSSAAIAVASGGSSVVDVQAPRGGGEFGEVAVEAQCVEQWAVVVKAIHAECVDVRGTSHPATRMRPETWLDSSMNAEIYRCLEGSRLHVLVGDVVESDQGMAGVYQGAQVVECAPGQSLRHFRDGSVKCAVAEQVPDCTERSNMRRYGLGDLFFSYQARVCARVAAGASAASATAYSQATGEVEVSGSFTGGVGE